MAAIQEHEHKGWLGLWERVSVGLGFGIYPIRMVMMNEIYETCDPFEGVTLGDLDELETRKDVFELSPMLKDLKWLRWSSSVNTFFRGGGAHA